MSGSKSSTTEKSINKSINYNNYIQGNSIIKLQILLIGDSEVGKTSLIQRFVNNTYNELYTPTNDISFYRKLHNFNKEKEEIEEYVYVEIIDTTSLKYNSQHENMRQTLCNNKNYFFDDFLKKDNIICSKHKHYYNHVKLPIKYEYNNSIQEVNQRGLFSISKIMAYVFVFDYNNIQSFDNILNYAADIKQNLYPNCNYLNLNNTDYNNNLTNKNDNKCLFFFIANKFDHSFIANNIDKINNKENNQINTIFSNDFSKKLNNIIFVSNNKKAKKNTLNNNKNNANDVSEKLINNYDNDESNKKNDFLYYVSAKYNYNVNNAFNSIFNYIYQYEDLWDKIQIEDTNNTSLDKVINNFKDEDKNFGYIKKENNFISRLFSCCFGSRHVSSREEKILKIYNRNKLLNEIDDNSYDKTEIINISENIENDDDLIYYQSNSESTS